jgi:cyclophilin family peptidyl-prolyl cis-trans isomerase
MRAVMVIIAIAIGAVLFSILLQPRGKDLIENPQIRDEERRGDHDKDKAGAPKPQQPEALNPPREGAITAVLKVKNRGELTVELYPKAAPKTVQHISDLIRKGFYDGIKFHRVVGSFVVQAGDPKTKTESVDAPGVGENGSGQTIPFEKNDLKNVMYSLGMARSKTMDSADSQFFINLANNKFLDSPDNPYCVFGQVIAGKEIAPKIQKGDVIESFSIK